MARLLNSLASLTRCASPPDKRRRLLADMDVIEADAVQELQRLAHPRHRLEKFQRFLDRHVEHVGDRFAAEQHFQRLAVVALAVADVAGDVNVGQKVHLDLDHAVALAGLAAAALDVEREAAGLVAAGLATPAGRRTIRGSA